MVKNYIIFIFAKQQFFIVTENCMCFVNHIEN